MIEWYLKELAQFREIKAIKDGIEKEIEQTNIEVAKHMLKEG